MAYHEIKHGRLSSAMTKQDQCENIVDEANLCVHIIASRTL